MPVGVIVDALAVVIGGIVGAVVGKKLKKDFIDNMNLILGCCSMCMGVSTIVLMQHMPAVVFAIILGTGLGLAVHFGKLINKSGLALHQCLADDRDWDLVVSCCRCPGMAGDIKGKLALDSYLNF